uniref:Putative plant transposon protein domain-containing protein n=1 Tax=Solanum tuberosum TaxID=4113 RepID=M1DNW2_SOLTU
MAQWTKHSGNRYHQSRPYAHMLREKHVWLKVVMNCLIPGIHYTDITRDRVCLVYALMTGTELNIGAILKSAMRKARVHKGHGMYVLEMLRHQNCCMASTDMQLGDVERHYPLNDHAKALLGIGPAFREPVDNDISTDEEHLRTSSDVESDSDEEAGPALAGDEVEGGDAMED